MSITVQTKFGRLIGAAKETCFGKPYKAFLGVPYAEQPVGRHRFRDPRPLKAWRATLDVTKDSLSNVCFQYDRHSRQVVGSDSCLKLYVFTRDTSPKRPKPVIVFIPGGAFRAGSGSPNIYGPDYLLEHDVIVVTVNYRFNLFGFLSLPEAGIPGNAGLKDQVQALKWVQESIADFGGDPENVTLFGESAGGISTHYHMMSPMSKDLFKQAIVLSTTAFSSGGFQRLDNTSKFTEVLGYKHDRDLLKFFEETDPSSIVKTELNFLDRKEKTSQMNLITFMPVVDGKFLPKHPNEMAKEAWGNRVNAIFGFCSNEGLLHHQATSILDPNMPGLFENLLVTSLDDTRDLDLKAKLLKNFYFNAENPMTFEHLVGDKLYMYSVYAAVRARTGPGKTFVCRFNMEPKYPNYDIVRENFRIPHKRGTAHTESLLYLFKHADIPAPQVGSEVWKLIMEVTKTFTDFARNGKSNKDGWISVDEEVHAIPCMDIKNDSIEFRTLPELARFKFWDSLLLNGDSKL